MNQRNWNPSWEGTVGQYSLEWEKPPVGVCGLARVFVRTAEAKEGGREFSVKWRRDQFGLTVLFPEKIQGFDFNREVSDDGESSWTLRFRNQTSSLPGLKFSRPGESASRVASGAKAKNLKVKSQMPGKIVKVLFEKGAAIAKGQTVLVMEAMKMENEIKASASGVLADLKVQAGQAVETGAELFSIQPS